MALLLQQLNLLQLLRIEHAIIIVQSSQGIDVSLCMCYMTTFIMINNIHILNVKVGIFGLSSLVLIVKELGGYIF
jgi:uncharacterized protein (DUF779 family)